MKGFKHALLSAALVTSFAVSSPRSEAMIALATIPGSVFMVPVIIGTAFSVAPFLYIEPNFSNGLLAVAGIIVFDKNANELEYQEITSKEQIKKFGLNASEVHAYNSELVNINLALAEMNSTLSNTPKNQLENVRGEVLETFKAEISKEAFSAVEKITNKAFSK